MNFPKTDKILIFNLEWLFMVTKYTEIMYDIYKYFIHFVKYWIVLLYT